MVKLVLFNKVSGFFTTFVQHTIQIRPLLNLISPLLQRRNRRNNKEWAKNILKHMQIIQKRNSLNSLTKSHLIC